MLSVASTIRSTSSMRLSIVPLFISVITGSIVISELTDLRYSEAAIALGVSSSASFSVNIVCL